MIRHQHKLCYVGTLHIIDSLFPNLKHQTALENIDIFDFNLELTDIAQIDNLNVNERQGKDPDKVAIGTLK